MTRFSIAATSGRTGRLPLTRARCQRAISPRTNSAKRSSLAAVGPSRCPNRLSISLRTAVRITLWLPEPEYLSAQRAPDDHSLFDDGPPPESGRELNRQQSGVWATASAPPTTVVVEAAQ